MNETADSRWRNLWLQKRRARLVADVAFMNKMVDEIVAERRKNADAAEGKKDMLRCQ